MLGGGKKATPLHRFSVAGALCKPPTPKGQVVSLLCKAAPILWILWIPYLQKYLTCLLCLHMLKKKCKAFPFRRVLHALLLYVVTARGCGLYIIFCICPFLKPVRFFLFVCFLNHASDFWRCFCEFSAYSLIF